MSYVDNFGYRKNKADIVKDGNYHFFYGGPYSQWAESHLDFCGVHFNTAEQFMMLGKAIVSDDEKSAKLIMKTPEPKDQKALGRKVKLNVKEWEYSKYDIVLLGNFLKFTQVKAYSNVLREHETVELFVEASPYDKIWGIGLSVDDALDTTPEQWHGENLLGKVVTEIRNLLVFGEFGPGATFAKLDDAFAIMNEDIEEFGLRNYQC